MLLIFQALSFELKICDSEDVSISFFITRKNIYFLYLNQLCVGEGKNGILKTEFLSPLLHSGYISFH